MPTRRTVLLFLLALCCAAGTRPDGSRRRTPAPRLAEIGDLSSSSSSSSTEVPDDDPADESHAASRLACAAPTPDEKLRFRGCALRSISDGECVPGGARLWVRGGTDLPHWDDATMRAAFGRTLRGGAAELAGRPSDAAAVVCARIQGALRAAFDACAAGGGARIDTSALCAAAAEVEGLAALERAISSRARRTPASKGASRAKSRSPVHGAALQIVRAMRQAAHARLIRDVAFALLCASSGDCRMRSAILRRFQHTANLSALHSRLNVLREIELVHRLPTPISAERRRGIVTDLEHTADAKSAAAQKHLSDMAECRSNIQKALSTIRSAGVEGSEQDADSSAAEECLGSLWRHHDSLARAAFAAETRAIVLRALAGIVAAAPDTAAIAADVRALAASLASKAARISKSARDAGAAGAQEREYCGAMARQAALLHAQLVVATRLASGPDGFVPERSENGFSAAVGGTRQLGYYPADMTLLERVARLHTDLRAARAALRRKRSDVRLRERQTGMAAFQAAELRRLAHVDLLLRWVCTGADAGDDPRPYSGSTLSAF